MDWQRARTPQQVKSRIDELIDAAGRLLEHVDLGEISLSMIARSAGWTRSNLYRYFTSKEEIYLELLDRDLAAWRLDVVKTCQTQEIAPLQFAEVSTVLFLKHERLVRLWSIVHTVLEKGTPPDRMARHRSQRFQEIGLTAQALSNALPFAGSGAASNFLLAQFSLLAGIYPMWSLGEKATEALARASVPHDPEYYRQLFTRSSEALLESSLSE